MIYVDDRNPESRAGRRREAPLRRPSRWAALGAAALLSTGCSFVLVKGPPSPERSAVSDARGFVAPCTHSIILPALDGTVGAVNVIAGVSALVDPDESRGEVPGGFGSIGVSFGIIGAVQSVVSAI